MTRSLGPIFATMLCSAGGPSGALADTPAGVGGVVLDAVTQQPVSTSLAFRRAGSPEFSIFSNTRGFFIALGLEPGRYAVTANASGRTVTCDLDVDSGEVHPLAPAVSLPD